MHACMHSWVSFEFSTSGQKRFRKTKPSLSQVSLEEEQEEDMDGEEGAVMVSGGVKCGRWNPTAEQVKVLMDLFKAGLRTPSTEEIQSITTHLSSYGKIESKNVFYWFQNHKHVNVIIRNAAGEQLRPLLRCSLLPLKEKLKVSTCLCVRCVYTCMHGMHW